MTNQFFDPSPKSNAPQFTASTLWALIKDRFESCPENKSFALMPSEGEFNESHVRTLVSRKAKAACKRFRVIKHETPEGFVFEITHVSDQRSMMRNDDVFDHSKETQYQQMDTEEAVDNEA